MSYPDNMLSWDFNATSNFLLRKLLVYDSRMFAFWLKLFLSRAWALESALVLVSLLEVPVRNAIVTLLRSIAGEASGVRNHPVSVLSELGHTHHGVCQWPQGRAAFL